MQEQRRLRNVLSRGSRPSWWLLAIACAFVALGAACSGGKAAKEQLFSPQNEELDVYDLSTGKMTVLIPGSVDGMDAGVGENVNGQVCQFPDSSGRMIMAEDHEQKQGERPGWSIFASGGSFERKIPEPQASNEPSNIEPYGCAFDTQGRLFVSDIGTEDIGGASGKLIMYFPPDYRSFCILDTTLRVAGALAVDEPGNVYVPEASPPGRVVRFSPPFPTAPAVCDQTAANKSTFIEDAAMATPLGIVPAPNGHWYVSSVFAPPTIREYDANGKFVRTIIEGSDIGNPAGLAVDSKGTIYYADLGLVAKPGGLPGPAQGKGTVRKVAFDASGQPGKPETMASGLDFPDAVSILKVK